MNEGGPSPAEASDGARGVADSWPRIVVALALLKVVVGLLAGGSLLFWLEEPFATRVPYLVAAALAFTAGAFVLLPSGRTNPAARYLGIVLLLAATTYANATIAWATSAMASAGFPNSFAYLQLSAFSPYFLWRFADVFPRDTPLGRPAKLLRALTRASLALALVLITANALMAVGPVVPALSEAGPLGWLRRRAEGTYYWAAVFVPTLSALGFLIWKTRRARAPERTRSLALSAAILLGAAPVLLVTIGEAFSETIRSLFDHPTSAFYTQLVMDVTILTIPFSTAYAVLRHKVIDVRLVVRKAIQYTLARYILIAGTLLPLTAMIAFLYVQRDQTVAQLITGARSLSLGGLSATALVALRFRRSWLDSLDRRFFREIHNLRQVLDDFAELNRNSRSTRDLALAVAQALNNALHLDRIAVLFPDPFGGAYLTPEGTTTTLPVAALSDVPAAIGALLADSTEPLIYDGERADRRLASVPPDDLNWLGDSGYRLLVPIHTHRGALTGAICLGEKRSDLPFSQEDRKLLLAVAEKCSEILEVRFLGPSADPGLATAAPTLIPGESATSGSLQETRRATASSAQMALECTSCGRIAASRTKDCAHCNSRLKKLEIPRVVNGKFELLERIGRGGMGVVYRASDLMLGRDVALKTLPKLSRRLSSRLRQEARAIARVKHPNLATIHGAETWRRIPILVLEYLPGGTLSDRIARGPLAPDEAARILTKIADALVAIHATGLLHRDVKPSNVGFLDGEPQLMDFGVAKLMFESGPFVGSEPPPASPPPISRRQRRGQATRSVAGTPLYMSPEALSGRRPDFDFDTWSTCVTFFEALTGEHPFLAEDRAATRHRILSVLARRLDEFDRDYAAELHRFFERAFSRRRDQRPTTATVLRDQLAGLQSLVNQAS